VYERVKRISLGDFNVVREMNEKWKNQGKKYLLILPCSKRKKRISNAYAIDLYDGPFYRMVRKNKPENLDILILSAKYGLIRYNEKISDYEQIMTVERAEELANSVYIKLKEILKMNHYDHVLINLGKTYVIALEKSKTMLSRYNVYWANGQIGERLNQLKNWLESICAGVEGAQ
jgi:predicted RNA-binding protein